MSDAQGRDEDDARAGADWRERCARQELDEAGRTLGHDLYRRSRMNRNATWPSSVLEGYDAAAYGGWARASADLFERKWLHLRLGAHRRGRGVAADVTPSLLSELYVPECPITRIALTHATLADTDWSVDRLNNDGAYAAGNLAVMSARANRAKGAFAFEQVLTFAKRGETAHGLEPVEWLRMAALMLGPTFAACHQLAPDVPQCSPLPLHAVRLAQQQVQRLFSEHATRPAGKNRLVRDFLPSCDNERAERRLRELADVVHEGLKAVDSMHACDVWLLPRSMEVFKSWREALGRLGWSRAARIAARMSDARRATSSQLRAWRLETGGYHWSL